MKTKWFSKYIFLANKLQFIALLWNRVLLVILRQLSLLSKHWYCHCIALWQQEQTTEWWIFNEKIDVYPQWIICYRIVNKTVFIIQCLGLFKYTTCELCPQGREAKVAAWAANLVVYKYIFLSGGSRSCLDQFSTWVCVCVCVCMSVYQKLNV